MGTLALATPALGSRVIVLFAAVAALAFVVDDGPMFELFARPGDRQDGRLNGLLGFALAAAGLALLATVLRREFLPVDAFVASILILAYGNLGEQLVEAYSSDLFLRAAGFTGFGFLGGLIGQVAVRFVATGDLALPLVTFLAATGALVAALLRSVLYKRDDPLVLFFVGLLLGLLLMLTSSVSAPEIAIALVLAVGFGYVAYALDTASVTGMLTGVLLSLLTIVLGGLGWFAVLISFFGIGGLSSKFRYEAKRRRGVAQENDGARGSGNVLGNAAVALVAVIGYAASANASVDSLYFVFAFAGSLAAAMSDTLSSEIGGLFDRPRLITTFKRVDPGTDGGVTWQGELAGFCGAILVALIATLFVSPNDPILSAEIIVFGGVIGMTVDSVLGATVEGDRLNNQSVNFFATLAGAIASVLLAIVVVSP